MASDRSKRNKLLFFRQSIDSILARVAGKTVIVFDTETTGLSAKLPWVQITEVAAIAFDMDTGRELGKFHKKVNLTPEALAEMAVQDRNIGPGDRGSLEGPAGLNIRDLLKMSRYGDNDAPRDDIVNVYQEFVAFINQYDRPVLLGQNAAFDMGHMFGPLKKLGIARPIHGEVIDTMVLGRVWIYPLLKAGEAMGDETSQQMLAGFNGTDREGKPRLAFSLVNLGRVFSVDAKHWHSGISDAMQTYGIFNAMLKFLQTAKERGFDTSDVFRQYHISMSCRAFSYGKRPAFRSTIKSDTDSGIKARGRPRR